MSLRQILKDVLGIGPAGLSGEVTDPTEPGHAPFHGTPAEYDAALEAMASVAYPPTARARRRPS